VGHLALDQRRRPDPFVGQLARGQHAEADRAQADLEPRVNRKVANLSPDGAA